MCTEDFVDHVGNTRVTDLVFDIDALILAGSLEDLVPVLEALDEEAKSLGLHIS